MKTMSSRTTQIFPANPNANVYLCGYFIAVEFLRIEDKMHLSIILAKITGVILLGFTIRSVFKHITSFKLVKNTDQSRTELLLNNALLYIWLLFMTAFSIGLIVNN